MDYSKLFQKKLLLVTGKGGVGKTLVASSLGIEAAKRGKKVCLVESTSEDQIGPLLGSGTIGHSLKKVRENLFVTNLHPELNFRDFIVLHLGFQTLFDKIFSKDIVRSFVRMIPGIAEITLLGRLYYYCNLETEHKFDLVILDGFASGHFLSLLSTPDAILNAGFVGPIVKETKRVRDYINDNSVCGGVVVCSPEPLVLNETIDFIERLSVISDLSIDALFINRYLGSLKFPEESPLSENRIINQILTKAHAQKEGLTMFRDTLHSSSKRNPFPHYLMPEFIHFEEPLSDNDLERWFKKGYQCPP